MQLIPRANVYAAIDTERDYQEQLRTASLERGNLQQSHELPTFLLYMQTYLNKAIFTSATDWSPECDRRTLESVRKVAALAVAAMEAHGAPPRISAPVLEAHGFEPQ